MPPEKKKKEKREKGKSVEEFLFFPYRSWHSFSEQNMSAFEMNIWSFTIKKKNCKRRGLGILLRVW